MKNVHKQSEACKQAMEAYTRREEGEHLPLFLRLRVSLHIILCPPCRRFIQQFKLILREIRSYRESASVTPFHQLDPERKQRIQEQLNKFG